MIRLSTFWITLIALLVIITILVVGRGIKKGRDKLHIATSLFGSYIAVTMLAIVMLTPIDTYFLDGETVTNVTNVKWNTKSKEYDITTEQGTKYEVKNSLSSDKNFISFDCKRVIKNILGLEIYTKKDILFVDMSRKGMSESEKEHMLDRIAPK